MRLRQIHPPRSPGGPFAFVSSAAISIPPILIGSTSLLSFSTPTNAFPIGPVNIGDIIYYFVTTFTNGATFSFSDNCSGFGYSVDAGPTNQGAAVGTSQVGHFVVGTNNASATLSVTWSGGVACVLTTVTIRGSSGLDVASAINSQNALSAGSDVINSGSSIVTSNTDLCIAACIDVNDAAGAVLSAGTILPWSIGTVSAPPPMSGSESLTKNSPGSIQATFSFTGGAASSVFPQCQLSCFKP